MLNQNVNDILKETILHNTDYYTKVTLDTLVNMFNMEVNHELVSQFELSPQPHGKIHFSILFTGVIYGEYILSLDAKTALRMAKSFDSEIEVSDKTSFEEKVLPVISEAFNIIVGESITELSKTYEKLTMCPPKVSLGKISYSNYITGQSCIQTSAGNVNLTFFFDQATSDLTAAYKDTVNSLLSVNKELELTNIQLKEHQAKLVHSEKMASLGVMAAGVAHEINNPLAFVSSNFSTLESYIGIVKGLAVSTQGLLDILEKQDNALKESSLKDFKLAQEGQDINFIIEDTQSLIDETKEGITRIQEIVAGLKNFSHLDEKEFLEVDMNQELKNVIKLVANQVKFNCEVVTDFKEIPKIKCLAKQLNQVFVNLIVNASQAIGDQKGEVRIQTDHDEDFLIIRVKDNGPGMPKEVVEKIFDPFYTTKPIGEGTGLGLYISFGIVKDNKGTIEVNSEIGQGTEFVIKIPKNLELDK